jgi:hypothetical protein
VIAVGDAIRAAFATRWTAEDAEAITDALDAAASWENERLPLKDAAGFGVVADRTGVLTSAAQTQCRAVLASDPSDPRRASLLRMLDALIARQPGIALTTKGVFELDACHLRGVTIHDAVDPWNGA